MDRLLQEVRHEAWDGLIPTELSMDSSEVTSLQRPLPLYLLLPRMGFLPCVAEAISHHFGEVAPDAQRTLWLEEARSGEPLRWHIPTGVLFDLIAGTDTHVVEEEWREGGESHGSGEAWPGFARSHVLPWRITVHFQGCPRRQVFQLEEEGDIRRHYMNALKQALFLQSGSSRAGMTLARENQNRLWQALKTNDAKVFREMDTFLGADGEAVRLVPVRLLTGSAPPSQLPIPAKRLDGKPFTLRDCLCWFCPEVPWESQEAAKASPQERGAEGASGVATTATSPPTEGDIDTREEIAEKAGAKKQAPGESGMGAGSEQEGLPADFACDDNGVPGLDDGGLNSRKQAAALPRVLVQGVDVCLDDPILELWGALRHPDHFLYIVVRKRG